MKNEAPEMNEQTGNTIRFETPEQLAKVGEPLIHAPVVGERKVLGNTFTEIAREKSIEYRPSRGENIPEQVSTQQLHAEAIRRLNGQYGD
jgi:hypothetical protein